MVVGSIGFVIVEIDLCGFWLGLMNELFGQFDCYC